MPVLSDLLAGLSGGAHRGRRPHRAAVGQHADPAAAEPFAQTAAFQLEEISRYDDRGPAWYWNNLRTGEHTGTHFDAPDPLGDRQGRRGRRHGARAHGWSRPAVVLDFSAQAAADPDFLLEVDHVREWEADARPAPGRRLAALPHRLGRPVGRRRADFLNADDDRPAHARGLAGLRPLAGRGGAGHRPRRRDGRHRRRRGALLRPAVPVPRGAARQRQVRADPAAEPRPAAAHRRGADRRRRCRSSAGPAAPARVLALVER